MDDLVLFGYKFGKYFLVDRKCDVRIWLEKVKIMLSICENLKVVLI